MNSYDKFYQYLSDLAKTQERLAALLVEKLEAIQNVDLPRLDEIVKEEQVFVLMSKSFDTNIEKHRAVLSFKGETLREIITEFPDEEQQRFQDLFKVLQSSVHQAGELNETCQELLEERMHSIQKLLREHDNAAGSSYGAKAAKPSEDAHFFSQKV